MRLSHSDSHRMLNILPRLYAYASPTQFFHTTISLLQEFVRCERAGCWVYEYTDRFRLRTAVDTGGGVSPRVAALIEEALPSHPYVAHYQAHEKTAVMLSDLPLRARRAHRDQYQEVYRLHGMHYEITLPLTLSARAMVGLSLARNRHDFTERDRTVLNLLQPHLQRAYSNAQLIGNGHDGRGIMPECATVFDLTDRETQVAFWMAEGKTNGEIGMILGIGARTVEKHVEHVLHKLCVENRTTAAMRLKSIGPRHRNDDRNDSGDVPVAVEI